MDRLLLQQVVCALNKSSDSFEPDRVRSLFDRLLTVAKDSSSLGQVVWCSVKQRHSHQVAIYILNRLVEYSAVNKWNMTSIVNYAHTAECFTPLHFASSLANSDLVEQLLQLGADVWRPSTHGQIALHFALKQAKANICTKVFTVIGMLCKQMAVTSADQGQTMELFRKFAIVPNVIETNNRSILEIITEQCHIRFDYRLYLQYFEYALQCTARDDVIEYLLNQMKKCDQKTNEDASPVDLALQYNNLQVMLKSVQLGFHCSNTLFDNGCVLLRRTLISERQIEQFPTANKCFHYLLQQMVKSLGNFSSPQTIKQLHQLVSYKFSFKVCYRLNEPEVVINGNYLTFSLLNHCGSMTRSFAKMPIPVQFKVENNLLRYYRFSRHDETALKCLLEQNRLDFDFGQKKFMQYFQQNCYPLYDISNRNNLDDDDNDEYARDKDQFQQFYKWLDNHYSQPKTLTTLARNVILNHYWCYECNDECNKCQSSLQNMNKMVEKIYFVEKYLGKSLFNLIFRCSICC